MSEPAHTFGPDCPHCGDNRPGTRCDLSGYSARRVRFILAHREAYAVAYLNPDSRAASHEQERLEREYRTLPPRHSCSCHCPDERRCYPRCPECKRLDDERTKGPDVGVEIGRTSPVNAPMPSPVMLDLARAEDVLGEYADPAALARFMSLNGSSLEPDVAARPRAGPVAVERELQCLMCSRPGVTGQCQCGSCGGCLVVVTVA